MKDAALRSAHPESNTVDGKSTDGAPSYVVVYSFVVWDHDRGETMTYPRMATPATIAKMRGKVNEDTAWVVDQSELDVEGFYSGEGPPSRE